MTRRQIAVKTVTSARRSKRELTVIGQVLKAAAAGLARIPKAWQ